MPSHDDSSNADIVRVALLLPVLIGGLTLVGVSRSLTPEEGSFLLRCRDVQADGGLVHGIGRTWGAIAGTLEEPSRGLSMLCALIAVACVGFVAGRRGIGATFAAMLVMMATPAFWLEGTGIGTSAPLTALLALAVAGVAVVTRAGPAAAGRFALLAAAGLPVFFDGGDGGDGLARLCCLNAGSIGHAVPTSVLAVATAAAVLVVRWGAARRSVAIDVALIAAAVAAPRTLSHFGLGGDDPLLSTAALPGIALVLAGPARAATGVSTLLLLALCLSAFTGVHAETRRHDGPDPRESLDWVRDQIDGRAWALAIGPRRDVYAFHELSGHRTGHVWYAPTSSEELLRLVEAAAAAKTPVITLLGEDDEVVRAFAKYYDTITIVGAPADLTLLGWRTG